MMEAAKRSGLTSRSPAAPGAGEVRSEVCSAVEGRETWDASKAASREEAPAVRSVVVAVRPALGTRPVTRLSAGDLVHRAAAGLSSCTALRPAAVVVVGGGGDGGSVGAADSGVAVHATTYGDAAVAGDLTTSTVPGVAGDIHRESPPAAGGNASECALSGAVGGGRGGTADVTVVERCFAPGLRTPLRDTPLR